MTPADDSPSGRPAPLSKTSESEGGWSRLITGLFVPHRMAVPVPASKGERLLLALTAMSVAVPIGLIVPLLPRSWGASNLAFQLDIPSEFTHDTMSTLAVWAALGAILITGVFLILGTYLVGAGRRGSSRINFLLIIAFLAATFGLFSAYLHKESVHGFLMLVITMAWLTTAAWSIAVSTRVLSPITAWMGEHLGARRGKDSSAQVGRTERRSSWRIPLVESERAFRTIGVVMWMSSAAVFGFVILVVLITSLGIAMTGGLRVPTQSNGYLIGDSPPGLTRMALMGSDGRIAVVNLVAVGDGYRRCGSVEIRLLMADDTLRPLVEPIKVVDVPLSSCPPPSR